SDIWSLGVVLHELLTQGLPFRSDSVAMLVTAALYEPHEPLSARRPDLPATIQSVIDPCLDKDPARRFATVAELAWALVPLGPPRCELSLERIVTVLGAQSAPPGVPPGGWSGATGRDGGRPQTPDGATMPAAPRAVVQGVLGSAPPAHAVGP